MISRLPELCERERVGFVENLCKNYSKYTLKKNQKKFGIIPLIN